MISKRRVSWAEFFGLWRVFAWRQSWHGRTHRPGLPPSRALAYTRGAWNAFGGRA